MPPRTRASSSQAKAPESSRPSKPSAQEKGKAKVTAEQSEWENEVATWMNTLKNCDFVVETSVDQPTDSIYKITESFDTIGWESIL